MRSEGKKEYLQRVIRECDGADTSLDGYNAVRASPALSLTLQVQETEAISCKHTALLVAKQPTQKSSGRRQHFKLKKHTRWNHTLIEQHREKGFTWTLLVGEWAAEQIGLVLQRSQRQGHGTGKPQQLQHRYSHGLERAGREQTRGTRK